MSISTAPFTLVSADGHSFEVDSLLLAGTSKVFRDMMSSGAGDRTCTLSESRKEIKLFLAAVEKGDCPTDEQSWLRLFRMADKYDSPLARSALLKASSTWVHSRPKAAYAASVTLGARDFAQLAAYPAVCSGKSSSLFSQLPEVERLRLELYGANGSPPDRFAE
ncbi:hypothetical protein JCM10213v2_002261 [Rhodosporidiobolus nylandii]